MNRLKIGEIADVQFGPHLKAEPTGAIKYLLGGHFDENLKLTNFAKSYVNHENRTNRFHLKPNDVILAGKGNRTFAWAYDETFGPMVPSSLFYLLRCPYDVVIGDYLAAVLNSERMQYQLGMVGSGATITSIPKKELNELEIHIPSMKDQQKFLEIHNLLDRDITLTNNLLQAKRDLKRGLVNKLLTQYSLNKPVRQLIKKNNK